MIIVDDLKLTYRTDIRAVQVLKGVRFQIRQGEKVAICGPSGSGKSTLLYILGGLLQPDSGRIEVLGSDIWNLDEPRRARFRAKRVGFVFQSFHLIPGWSVLQNAMLGAEYSPSGGLELRARLLLTRLGLGGLEDRTPSQLSGGQAQRVAIARALLMNPDLLLADEPTGALDTNTAKEILGIFDDIHREGKTVVIITHDEKVAATCDRIIHIVDGEIRDGGEISGVTDIRDKPDALYVEPPPVLAPEERVKRHPFAWFKETFEGFFASYSIKKSVGLMARNPSRSLLTLFGIAVGVAAVVSMISVGRFAKERILQSYSTLGVRNFKMWAYPNWQLSHSKPLEAFFRELKIEDLETLKRIFPDIQAYTPLIRFWQAEVSYMGKTVTQDVSMLGVNEHGIRLNQFEIASGRSLTELDLEDRNGVCIIGVELSKQLGISSVRTPGQSNSAEPNPLIFVKNRELSFACRVVGILAKKKSSGEGRWDKPGGELFLPHTFLRGIRGDSIYSNEGDLNQVLFEVREGVIPDVTSKRVKEHFERKFGQAGNFSAEANAKLISQMRKFLDIFNVLLIGIAFVTLMVGATGVTNMILVSLSERVRELGIRRAVGAEPSHLRHLVLGESLTLCAFAGLLGLTTALIVQHVALYFTSIFFPKIPFEWLFDPWAIGVSLVSIFVVGILSGLYPALRVERQDVVSALRSE